jgi:hypothetical protein
VLPESQDAKALYVEMRDARNRHRQWALSSSKGDMDALKSHVLDGLSLDSEMAGLREQVDFATSESLLTPEQIEAAHHAIAWGDTLRALLAETQSEIQVGAA